MPKNTYLVSGRGITLAAKSVSETYILVFLLCYGAINMFKLLGLEK